MENNNRHFVPKNKKNENMLALKVKTESKGLGAIKTLVVLLLIMSQIAVLILTYTYFARAFQWYFSLSILLSMIACVHVLSSEYHGQAKATWISFLMISFGFGYIIYFLSDKRVLFSKSKKKINKIQRATYDLQTQNNIENINSTSVKSTCKYLYNSGKFVSHFDTKMKYFSSGAALFDSIIEDLRNADSFVFIEYFIISDGVLFTRILDILKEKARAGVDVRIIYDDMGSHSTMKFKTKKDIISSGIKLQSFNRLVPVFNIALNLRDHRKIVCIDGKIAYTGGANLADEYINEKRMHGYWKDEGIRIEGPAVDNLTIAFLNQWQFVTDKAIEYNDYIGLAKSYKNISVCVPYVSGPHYNYSIAQNMYANQIANAEEKLYIMSPYFIPDETITNLIINKARAGVDVRIILPDIADKKFVYIVSRNNAEKLMSHGVKLYTMTSSFVHSKVVLTETSTIIGSINMDLRSFNQQFESAVFTDDSAVIQDVEKDFEYTFDRCTEITKNNSRRKKLSFRILAGLFNIISPFM